MTAISAHSANGTSSSTANPFVRDQVASLRTVQVPGTPATYANRAVLRGLGLRWDPANHRWHGTTTAAAVKTLREQFHLEVRVFGVLEIAPKGPATPTLPPVHPRPPGGPRDPRHDYSRTRLESRLALPAPDEDIEDFLTETRRFSLWDITSGLPDDSREEDEKQAERYIGDLRARVKRARALASSTRGLREILRDDWQKPACFYARCGITENLFHSD